MLQKLHSIAKYSRKNKFPATRNAILTDTARFLKHFSR
jgi:hypothetical protein